MKKIIGIFILVSAIATDFTYAAQTDFSLYADKGPTLSGEINYFMIEKGYFVKWKTDIEDKRSFFMQSWGRSIESAPTDNRPYLAALGIDLYNSIPPDQMPPPITQEQIDSDEEVDPIAFAPYKQQISGDFNALRPGGVALMYRESNWNTIPRLSPEKQIIAVERHYLLEYLREQIANGNIVIDNYDAPASIDTSKIDVRNPTYYKVISDYMEKMKPAMEARISPWEADFYMANYKAIPNTAEPEPTPATIEPATENPNSNSETDTTDTTRFIKYQPHWLWYVLILGAVIGIVSVMFARRKK